MPRRREADKNLLEGLAVAAMAAKSFLDVYYKAKKELEGVYSPAPHTGDKVSRAVAKRELSVMRSVVKSKN